MCQANFLSDRTNNVYAGINLIGLVFSVPRLVVLTVKSRQAKNLTTCTALAGSDLTSSTVL